MAPNSRRYIAWQRLQDLLPPRFYTLVISEITLDSVVEKAHELLSGQVTGRLLVNPASKLPRLPH